MKKRATVKTQLDKRYPQVPDSPKLGITVLLQVCISAGNFGVCPEIEKCEVWSRHSGHCGMNVLPYRLLVTAGAPRLRVAASWFRLFAEDYSDHHYALWCSSLVYSRLCLRRKQKRTQSVPRVSRCGYLDSCLVKRNVLRLNLQIFKPRGLSCLNYVWKGWWTEQEWTREAMCV
jgi:hypothetical protein